MNTRTTRVLVFVPTYNDSVGLGDVCASVLELAGDIAVLVVDDGSAPPIESTDLPNKAMLVRLPDNYGLGVATHVAIGHMLAADYDILVRVDGDGQHPVLQIPELVSRVVDGGFDFVVGARPPNVGDRSFRGFAVRIVHRYYKFLGGLMASGRSIGDPTCGFHALNRRTAVELQGLPLERYPEPEIAVVAMTSGLRVGEVPIQLRSRADGASTISLQRGLLLLYRFNVFALGQLLKKIAQR